MAYEALEGLMKPLGARSSRMGSFSLMFFLCWLRLVQAGDLVSPPRPYKAPKGLTREREREREREARLG